MLGSVIRMDGASLLPHRCRRDAGRGVPVISFRSGDFVSFRHAGRFNAVFIDGHAAPLTAMNELRAGENQQVEIYRQFVPKWNGEVY